MSKCASSPPCSLPSPRFRSQPRLPQRRPRPIPSPLSTSCSAPGPPKATAPPGSAGRRAPVPILPPHSASRPHCLVRRQLQWSQTGLIPPTNLTIFSDTHGLAVHNASLFALYLDSEGHVIYYTITTPDPHTAIFLSQSSSPSQHILIFRHLPPRRRRPQSHHDR